jgi:PAS domain-containing protein
MADDNLREELSRFLKTRRARLAPGDVGLTAVSGRRIRGLRREEVAVLAGVGLTWYTWLEQGREIKVSTPFIENLARALRLSEAERTHLFALAQHRPPPLAAQSSPSEGLEKVQAILDAIDHPAYARNNRFDVLAWNAANTRMFGDFASIPAEQRNIVRLMFSRPYYRRTMLNWEQDARSLVAKFRLSYGQAAGDPDFSSFAQEMLTTSEDFRRMWADHEVTSAGEGVYFYRTRRRGVLVFQHSTLVPEVRPDLRIVVYLPQDGP